MPLEKVAAFNHATFATHICTAHPVTMTAGRCVLSGYSYKPDIQCGFTITRKWLAFCNTVATIERDQVRRFSYYYSVVRTVRST